MRTASFRYLIFTLSGLPSCLSVLYLDRHVDRSDNNLDTQTMESDVSTKEIADRVRLALPNVKIGSLRFWGVWFGRPHDAWHQIVKSTSSNNVLYLEFNEREVLSIWSPVDVTISERVFNVSDASRVRWEWYSYGDPKTPENRYFEDFVKSSHGIEWTTNIDWYKPEFHPVASAPAVEIL